MLHQIAVDLHRYRIRSYYAPMVQLKVKLFFIAIVLIYK